MADIKTQITLKDKVSGTLERIYNTMSQATSRAEKLNSSMKKQEDVMNRANKQAKYYVNSANKVVDAQGRFVSSTEFAKTGLKKEELALRKVNRTAKKSIGIFGKLGGKMKSVFGGLSGLLGGIAIGASALTLGKQSDEFANMNARLKMINDGLNTTKELQTAIYFSAQKTGSAFNEVANGVAKMRMQAGDTFTNNAETLQFLETMNKSFVVGGASIEEQKSAMLQLTQAMASGKLQGDELRSLAETSPALIQAISSHLGVSRGEIKKLGAEGKLTAEVVKNSMLSATDKINKEFEQMPKTWGRVWQEMKNYSLRALEPVLQKLNDFINSERGAKMIAIAKTTVDIIANVMNYAIDVIIKVYDMFDGLFSYIKKNWDWLEPIVKGITVALVSFYLLNSVIGKVMTVVSTAKTIMATFGSVTKMVGMAQTGFAGAMASTPFGWYIGAIALVIGALYGLVAVINHVTGSSISATGILTGLASVVYSVVYNVVAQCVNIVMAFAEFLVNVFIDPMFAIQMLWYNLVMAIGGYLMSALQVVDAFINFAVNMFFELEYQVQTAWYNIAQGCFSMAGAIGMAIDGIINNVITGIESMINSVLGGINKMISALNALPKVDLPSIGNVSLGRASVGASVQGAISSMTAPSKKSWGGSNLAGGLQGMMDGMDKPTSDKNVWTAPKMDYKNHLESAQKGYEKGSAFADKVGGIFDSHEGTADSLNSAFDMADKFSNGIGQPLTGGGGGGGRGGGSKNPTGGKLDSIGKIEDEIAIDDETIKLIKDVANQEWQQKFIKLEPKIVTNIGEVKSEREYANVLDDLNAKIVNAINNGADGI